MASTSVWRASWPAAGLLDGPAFDEFFADPLDGLHDPRLLPDAEAFAARIGRARAAGERILVFGDFDADGLTGLAILDDHPASPRHRGHSLRPQPARRGPRPVDGRDRLPRERQAPRSS